MRYRRLAGRFLVVCLLAGSTVASGQDLVTFEEITFAATSIGFSVATIRPSGGLQMVRCVGRLRAAEVFFRHDGTAPTATVGIAWSPGDTLTLVGNNNLLNFRGIRTSATSGVGAFHCFQQ